MDKTFELITESQQIRSLRCEMREILLAAGLDEKATGEVLLAVQEILTNVLRHAYGGKPGPVKVVFRETSDRVKIAIEDHGGRFDPTKVPDPDLPRETPGGLGIYFVKKMTDCLEYDANFTEGNRLYLTKLKKNCNSDIKS